MHKRHFVLAGALKSEALKKYPSKKTLFCKRRKKTKIKQAKQTAIRRPHLAATLFSYSPYIGRIDTTSLRNIHAPSSYVFNCLSNCPYRFFSPPYFSFFSEKNDSTNAYERLAKPP